MNGSTLPHKGDFIVRSSHPEMSLDGNDSLGKQTDAEISFLSICSCFSAQWLVVNFGALKNFFFIHSLDI